MFYVSVRVITRGEKTHRRLKKKKTNESKHATVEKYQTTTDHSTGGRKRQRICKIPASSEQKGNSRPFSTTLDAKAPPKSQVSDWVKKMSPNSRLPIRDSPHL